MKPLWTPKGWGASEAMGPSYAKSEPWGSSGVRCKDFDGSGLKVWGFGGFLGECRLLGLWISGFRV